MKTKFIKVHVDDKLPDTFGHYVTFNIHDQKGYHYFDDGEKQFWSDDEIHEWLIEVPDREEEMRELLEKARIVIARMKRSMLVHPDHEEGREFDDLTTSAQDMENEIGEYLLNK